MNRDDLLGHRTDKERAADYLHRRSMPRPAVPPQTEGLFDEPEHQKRQFVPLGQPVAPADSLFPEPEHQKRALIAVTGWPDYRAQGRREGNHAT